MDFSLLVTRTSGPLPPPENRSPTLVSLGWTPPASWTRVASMSCQVTSPVCESVRARRTGPSLSWSVNVPSGLANVRDDSVVTPVTSTAWPVWRATSRALTRSGRRESSAFGVVAAAAGFAGLPGKAWGLGRSSSSVTTRVSANRPASMRARRGRRMKTLFRVAAAHDGERHRATRPGRTPDGNYHRHARSRSRAPLEGTGDAEAGEAVHIRAVRGVPEQLSSVPS